MSEKKKKMMGMLKKHFRHDEEDEDEQVKPMELFENKKDRRVALNEDYDEDLEPHNGIYGADGHSTDENRMYGENANSNDEGYDSVPEEDDEEYEKKQRKELSEDTSPQLSKSQRKRLAVSSISRKMSKPKK